MDNILFTGYILATDVITVDMHVAYVVYVLQKYVQEDVEIISLLQNRVMHFVPILNPDTLNFLSSYHLKSGHTKMLYKNRRIDKITSLTECGESGIGVNLNRNFPIGFDFNPQRSQQSCHPSY